MKEWRVYSKPEPGKEKGGVIIWWPEWDGRDAREWFRENVEGAEPGHFYHGATLELVEFETPEERTERELRARVAELEAGLLAVLGPDHLTEYECEHGTPLGRPCFGDCHLNPTRRALGITGTIPDDAE